MNNVAFRSEPSPFLLTEHLSQEICAVPGAVQRNSETIAFPLSCTDGISKRSYVLTWGDHERTQDPLTLNRPLKPVVKGDQESARRTEQYTNRTTTEPIAPLFVSVGATSTLWCKATTARYGASAGKPGNTRTASVCDRSNASITGELLRRSSAI